MKDEMAAHERNGTWVLVDRPQDVPVISCKWVFKLKKDKNGQIEKYKSRLVARGFTQEYGTNYFETYAPVVRNSSIRILLAIAVERGYFVEQTDVRNAYINSELNEIIYMQQPEGFKVDNNKVCLLKKALYGLKQSGNEWNKLLNGVIVNQMGFRRLKSDPCVYIKGELIMACYVDDILILGSNKCEIQKEKECLMKYFSISDMGEVNKIIGINVARSENEIRIDQKRYTEDLLEKFGMFNCNPVKTPVDVNVKFEGCVQDPCQDCGKVDPTEYKTIIGSLMFLAVSTRPDIAFVVSMLSRFNAKPHLSHLSAAKRVLRYLRGSSSCGVTYKKDGPTCAYVDADWASDLVDRRSYTGYVVLMCGGAVAWESKKQPTVALSSTEAEYMAAAQASKEVIFVRNFLLELNLGELFTVPVRIFCDNNGAIELTRNVGFHNRTKHIDIRHHFVRDLVIGGLIDFQRVNSEQNVADILTKGLGNNIHSLHFNKILN